MPQVVAGGFRISGTCWSLWRPFPAFRRRRYALARHSSALCSRLRTTLTSRKCESPRRLRLWIAHVPLRNLRQAMVLAIAYHFVASELLPSVQFAPKLLKAAPAGFSPYKPVRPAEVAVAVKLARHSRQQQTLFGSEVAARSIGVRLSLRSDRSVRPLDR